MLALAVVLHVFGAVGAQAGELEVLVIGVRTDAGTVRVVVYDTPGRWPDNGAWHAGKTVRIGPAGALAVFNELAPGRYAIAAYHDENANGVFDRGFMGFPLEGFGFGNDAAVMLSAPDFDAAAVSVTPGRSRVTLKLRYW